MPRAKTPRMSRRRIKELVFQLPPRDFFSLIDEMNDRAETMMMMRIAETGLQDWLDPREDIYDAEPKAR